MTSTRLPPSQTCVVVAAAAVPSATVSLVVLLWCPAPS
jgi:hypothetical protein